MKNKIKSIIRKAYSAVKDTMSGFVFLRRDWHRVRTQVVCILSKKIPCHSGRRSALRFHLGCGEHRRTMSQFLLYLFYEMIPALQTGRNDTIQKNAKCLRREIIAFLLFTFSFLLFTAGAARAGDNIINSNIGIGRTSTQANLHVGGSTMVDGDLTTNASLTASSLFLADGTKITGSGTDTDWTVDGSDQYSGVAGNVGIGTASPESKLHVVGDLTVTGSIYSAGKSVIGNDYTIPSFGAYRSAAQTIPTTTWTQVQFDTELFDTNANYSTSTYRFTPTVAGKYIFTTTAGFNSIGDGDYMYVRIYKNAASIASGGLTFQGAAGAAISSCSAIADANGTTDYFSVYIIHDFGSDRDTLTGFHLSFYGSRIDASNGLWSQEANSVAYYSGGNVGIGTSAPDAELDVVGGLSISGDLTITNILSPSSTVYYAVVDEAGTLGKSGVQFPTGSASTEWVDQGAYLEPGDANESVQIAKCLTVNTNVLVANNAGNVGIGTTAPEEKLHVVGDLTVTGSIYSAGKSVIGNDYTIPSFSVYRSAVQSIPTNTWTQVQCNTEFFDTNSNFDTSTYRFTPTVAGKYLLTGRCAIQGLADADYTDVAIYKNGAILHVGSLVLQGGTAGAGSTVSAVVDANGTTDYFELYVYHNYGDVRDTGGAIYNDYFTGCRIDASNGLWSQEANSVAYYSGGNVGVGTSAPGAQLGVQGDLSMTGDLTVSRNLSVGSIFSDATSGNVGIGTRSPAAAVDINGVTWLRGSGVTSAEVDILFEGNGAIGSQGYQYFVIDANNDDSNSSFIWQRDQDGRLGTQLMSLNNDGDLNITGTISKGAGSFDIPHPDPVKEADGWRLRHCFVESPTRGDNLYRWTVEVTDGSSILELPDYFHYLNENVQVWVSPKGHFGSAYGEVNEALTELTVVANADGLYNVLAVGTRKDPIATNFFDEKGVEYRNEE